MGALPYVLLSAAMSLDGYLDDTGPERLLLSNPGDFDRVDELRGWADAILVGANTVRTDDPRLLVRADERRQARVEAGRPEHPVKVVVTGSGDVSAAAALWRTGAHKLVLTTDAAAPVVQQRLAGLAEVVAVGPTFDWTTALTELRHRGIARLMVEGGGSVHTQLLAADLVDEIQLAIAPLVVGQAEAPRFLGPARYRFAPGHRFRLLEARTVGDVVLVRYAPKERGGEG